MQRQRRGTANGFTLLEMMVALAIFALAALSLMKLQSFTLANAAEVEGSAMAQLTLQNQLGRNADQPRALGRRYDRGASGIMAGKDGVGVRW